MTHRKTHWTVPDLSKLKKKKVSKLRFVEFRHQIESNLGMELLLGNVKPKQLKTAQEWLNWLSKTYKERNEESL